MLYGCNPDFLFDFLCASSATQALGQRPAGASAAPAPVRAMPQYKYAAGVRNPQQHMASQPQVAMQQVPTPPPTHRTSTLDWPFFLIENMTLQDLLNSRTSSGSVVCG